MSEPLKTTVVLKFRGKNKINQHRQEQDRSRTAYSAQNNSAIRHQRVNVTVNNQQ